MSKRIYKNEEFQIRKLGEVSDTITGRFLMTRKVLGAFEDAKAHYFICPLNPHEEQPVILWGNGDLDFQILQLDRGDYVRITYKGKKDVTGNGHLVKVYDVVPIDPPVGGKG